MAYITLPSRNAKVAAENALATYWKEWIFPVDPVVIAQKIGISVKQADLPSEISGALIRRKGQDPTIFIDRRDSMSRRRFTCAHEIGHFYDRFGDEEIEHIDLRNQDSGAGTDSREVFANQFAANLLMPESEVQRLQDWPLFMLMEYFGVSDQSLQFRLKNLNIQHRELRDS